MTTDANVEKVKNLRKIGDVDISFQAISTSILGIRRMSEKFVPELLRFDQKKRRVSIVQELLNDTHDDLDLLKGLIAGFIRLRIFPVPKTTETDERT